MRKYLAAAGVLAVLVSGVGGVVVAVSAAVGAFNAAVDNAITVPPNLDGFLGTTVFPVEFLVAPIPVQLSASFLADPAFTTVTAEVWVRCKDPAQFPNAKWMGDVAYLAPRDPQGVLPGGGAADIFPPSVMASAPNKPWLYIGGNPRNCPGNLIGVLTQAGANAIVLDKSSPENNSATLFLGVDVPLCKFNFNLSTHPTPKPSGWHLPTVVLKKGDPRFEAETVDRDCAYDLGMEVVIKVVDIR